MNSNYSVVVDVDNIETLKENIKNDFDDYITCINKLKNSMMDFRECYNSNKANKIEDRMITFLNNQLEYSKNKESEIEFILRNVVDIYNDALNDINDSIV